MIFLQPQDIWPREKFLQERGQILPNIIKQKSARRIFLGDHASVLFESRRLIWWHIQEMLRVEPGAEVAEELAVYNPLLPQKNRLSVTFMLEYPDESERRQQLPRLVGIEQTLSLNIGGVCHVFSAHEPGEEDPSKAHAVNFLHLCITPEDFQEPALLTLQHPFYTAETPLPPTLYETLKRELTDPELSATL
jgi:hypothetical protein